MVCTIALLFHIRNNNGFDDNSSFDIVLHDQVPILWMVKEGSCFSGGVSMMAVMSSS